MSMILGLEIGGTKCSVWAGPARSGGNAAAGAPDFPHNSRTEGMLSRAGPRRGTPFFGSTRETWRRWGSAAEAPWTRFMA